MSGFRPHVLGIDDGPFDKNTDQSVPVVGVMMEAHDLVEAVAITRFPVDGGDATGFLAEWIGGLRFASALHGIVLGGVTIAGLGIVDVERLAELTGIPVMIVNRHAPRDAGLSEALAAAGLADRIAIVEKTPRAWRLEPGLHVAQAGMNRADAARILVAAKAKSRLPEPLRLAHLIGGAIASGQSRGRP